jgi:hypothetical protein
MAVHLGESDYAAATPMEVVCATCILWHPSLLVSKPTAIAFTVNLFHLLSLEPIGVVVVATMVLILPRDICHHPLKTRGVAFLVGRVDEISVNHLMDKGSLNLGQVIAKISEKLFGKVNFLHRKLLAHSPESHHPASFISTITRRGSHSGIPDYGDIGNLAIEMFFIESDKHFFDIRLKHGVSLVTLSYNR